MAEEARTVKMKHPDGRVADVNNNESVDMMKAAGFKVVAADKVVPEKPANKDADSKDADKS